VLEIDLETKTLYAELLSRMQALHAFRPVAGLKGSFSINKVAGRDYVYFHHHAIGGRLVQVYVGALDNTTERLMREYAEGKTDVRAAREIGWRLAIRIPAGVDMLTDKLTARVMRSLAGAGVFRLGGVVVGTHAYKAIGMMYGVSWQLDTIVTSDIASRNVSVAIPMITADIPTVMDSLNMGFLPVPDMNLQQPSTFFVVRRDRLRLDVLTPKTTKSYDSVFIPRFGCAAMPLDYLSYLIESPVQAVLINNDDPVLINVPQPARYALHKLIVSQIRNRSNSTKSNKDLHQAHQLLSLIQTIQPDDIRSAWENLIARGPKWRKPAEKGMKSMRRLFGKLRVDPREGMPPEENRFKREQTG
jgi:hypothetical protein